MEYLEVLSWAEYSLWITLTNDVIVIICMLTMPNFLPHYHKLSSSKSSTELRLETPSFYIQKGLPFGKPHFKQSESRMSRKYSCWLFQKIITTEKPSYLYEIITFRTDVHNPTLGLKLDLMQLPVSKRHFKQSDCRMSRKYSWHCSRKSLLLRNHRTFTKK